MKIQVEGSPHLFRDGGTSAIVNTNYSEYENYLSLKERKTKENNRIKNLENELMSVKDDIKDLKDLILGLYNK